MHYGKFIDFFHYVFRVLTTFILKGEVYFLLKSEQGEMEDNRQKWGHLLGVVDCI